MAKPSVLRSRASTVATATVVALCALMLSAAPTPASTTPSDSLYVAQAKKAGLTKAQTTALQQKVNGYVAKVPDSRQTGPNTVAFPGGKVIVGVPGEKYGRDLRTTLQPRTSAAPCNGLAYFCATWHVDPNTTIQFDSCDTFDVSYLYGSGTWQNNQQNRMRVHMYGSGGTSSGPIYTTPNAYSEDMTANWSPVFSLKNCVPAR